MFSTTPYNVLFSSGTLAHLNCFPLERTRMAAIATASQVAAAATEMHYQKADLSLGITAKNHAVLNPEWSERRRYRQPGRRNQAGRPPV